MLGPVQGEQNRQAPLATALLTLSGATDAVKGRWGLPGAGGMWGRRASDPCPPLQCCAMPAWQHGNSLYCDLYLYVSAAPAMSLSIKAVDQNSSLCFLSLKTFEHKEAVNEAPHGPHAAGGSP